MTKKNVLIVDDEADIRTLTALTFERMGLACTTAANIQEAKAALQKQAFHFCITDMKLPDGNGLELINYCQKHHPSMPIAMITAFGNMELGVNALKAGAFDVVAKPLDISRLRILAQDALNLIQAPAHISSLPSHTSLLGNSNALVQLKEEIGKVARTQAPVFIQGELGTGKELAARLIHHQSSRSEQPFIRVSCSPKDTPNLDHVLFNPDNPQQALIYQARNGTLFLDNIEQLSSELQLKLLNVLQTKQLPALSLNASLAVDFRFISATTKDITHYVKNGVFRQDLYFRIYVISLTSPALRDRGEDIELLSQHFIQRYAEQWGTPTLTPAPEALAALKAYAFPGNIDELQAILQRAVTLAEQDCISLDDLHLTTQSNSDNSVDITSIETNNLEGYLENIERQAIMQALAHCRWNKTAAAAKLGISFRTMRYRCKKLDID